MDCGRRFGKDIIQRNYISEGIIAGEHCAWYEPTYKSLLDNWEWFCNALYPITARKSDQEKRLELSTGGMLDMWSLQDKDASRGRHYRRVAVNEAAKVEHLEYSWNNVIRITLADLAGGAMIGSTPRGRNYFKTLFDRGNDPQEVEWSSWKMSTYRNPFIAKSEIDEIKRTTPELIFQQEILAEFIEVEGSVFRRIQEAATLEPIDAPEAGRQYIAAVDPAASVDYTVVTIWDVQAKHCVYMDRFNRVDYQVLGDRLHSAYKRFNCQSMTIEVNGIGQGVVDHLAGRGMSVRPFTTTSATKQAIITKLQSAFEHSEIRIVNNAVMIGELLSFEAKRSPSGNYQYAAPDGMHDDTVMSLAIGWDAINSGRRVSFGSV